MCKNDIKKLFGFDEQERLEANRLEAERDRTRIFATESQAAEKQRQEMLRREAERQRNIQTGNSAIDQAFAQFNPQFFQGVQGAYTDAYLPEIEDQRKKALAKMTAGLASKGMLESSAGINQLADVEKLAGTTKAKVANDALDFSNKLRGNVDSTRDRLYDFSLSAADPSSVAARAQGEATTLAQTNPVAAANPSSLGDVFGAFLQPLAYAAVAAGNTPRTQKQNPTGFAPVTGSGSAKYIG